MVETRPVGCGLFVFGLFWLSLFFSPPSDCSSLPSTMTWEPCPHGVRTRGKKILAARPPALIVHWTFAKAQSAAERSGEAGQHCEPCASSPRSEFSTPCFAADWATLGKLAQVLPLATQEGELSAGGRERQNALVACEALVSSSSRC